jgi:hypothetical protein
MMDFHTAERIIRDLKYAETLGYNALVATTDEYTRRFLRQYRNEGGKMMWIAQTHVPQDLRVCVNIATEGGAIAIFHQGTHFDGLLEEGNLDGVRKNLEILRGAGIPVGAATHVPEHVTLCENEFKLDFYMACLHNMRRGNENRVSSSISGKKSEPHSFVHEDRAAMYKMIQSLGKPCIAYKILAGGNYAMNREDLKRCFVEAFANIKPNDFATVGTFQRDKDQLRENALLLEEVLGG